MKRKYELFEEIISKDAKSKGKRNYTIREIRELLKTDFAKDKKLKYENLPPNDFCYNKVNKATDAMNKRFLEEIKESRDGDFKYLGFNYRYNGEVKDKEGKVVGAWVDGKYSSNSRI